MTTPSFDESAPPSEDPEVVPETPSFVIETLTPDELEIFKKLQAELTTPEDENPHVRVWFDSRHPENALTNAERKVLTKVYGQPRRSVLSYRIVGTTKGEACADNERNLPSSESQRHYGVWDKNLVVFALYNVARGEKLRVVGSGLVVGVNGRVLLPGYFYTPKGDTLRDLLMDEIAADPRHDHSINLGPAYESGQVSSTNVELTVYRPIGSRFSWGDLMDNGNVLQGLVAKANLDRPYGEGSSEEYLFVQKVDQLLEQHLKNLVTSSNTQRMREAFNQPANVRQITLKSNSPLIYTKAVDSGEDVGVLTRSLEGQAIPAITDPTWRFSNETAPLVIKLRLPPENEEKFYFVSQDLAA